MEPMSRVAVVLCDSYDPRRVETAVRRGIELLGGAAAFVRPGEGLLLKPNLLAPDPPEKSVTTHPTVFAAVAKVLQEAKADLSFGDSPGLGSPGLAASRSGILAQADSLGIPLADFTTPQVVAFPAGVQNKQFTLARAAAEHRGAIINLPKFKTHGFLRLTCAIKNSLGCIPGLLKAEFHVKLPDPHAFARMLVDLNGCLRPRLHVLDGIVAMEGNGPRSGKSFPLGLLMFSADPVALDATAARWVGVDPDILPTIRYGVQQGLGRSDASAIDVVGSSLPARPIRSFETVRTPVPALGIVPASPRQAWLKSFLVPKPVIQAGRCTRCGTCVKVCPVAPKALAWADAGHHHPPVYAYDRCIRCYCCQEMCPEKAITIRTPWLGRLIRRA